MINLRNRDYWTRYLPSSHPDTPAPFVEKASQEFNVRTSRGIVPVKSMLTSYELSILFALAKDYWTGAGEIVDLGCLYGLTTRCFADGMALNDKVVAEQKIKRLFAYDLFLAEDYEWWLKRSSTLHGGSWFPEFLDLNRDRLAYIVPCPGDLLKMNWGKNPIEILMVDAAKSWELNHFVVSRMFPRLIPGQSIVVQQDYMHFAEFWVAITMEYYSDCFEPLDFVYGASGVFLTTREISGERAGFDLATLSASEKKRLIDRAIEKAPAAGAEVLKTAKAQLLLEIGEIAEAKRLMATVNPGKLTDSPIDDFSPVVAGCMNIVGHNIEAIEHAAQEALQQEEFQNKRREPANQSACSSSGLAESASPAWQGADASATPLSRAAAPIPDSRGKNGLSGELKLLSASSLVLKCGEPLVVRMSARNSGAAIWLPSGDARGSVSVGGMLHGADASVPFRFHLSSTPVEPGASIEATLNFDPPSPGRYELEIDLVSEYVVWFKKLGGRDLTMDIEVAAP